MLNKQDREELERLLRNYLLAIESTGGAGCHPMWKQAGRSGRTQTSVPILYGEADRVQRALRLMEPYKRSLLRWHYFETQTEETKAKIFKMHRTTYWRWVRKAEDEFMYVYRNNAHTFAPAAAAVSVEESAAWLDERFTLPQKKKKRRRKPALSTAKRRASKGAQA